MAKKKVGKKVETVKASSSERKEKKRKLSGLILFFMIVALVVLIGLIFVLLVQTGYVKNPLENLHFSTQEFQIKDECSMIVGNLIHSVQSEDVCQQKCKTECGVRKLYFYSSTFTEKQNDCHSCQCFCR